MGATGSLAEVFEGPNLKRAWRWVTSNPDKLYAEVCTPARTDCSKYIDEILAHVQDVGMPRLFSAVPSSASYSAENGGPFADIF